MLVSPAAAFGERGADEGAAVEPADRPASLVVSPGGAETAKGGDLISLSKPLTVRSARTLESGWANVPITSQAALPDALTGSVLVSVSSSSAKASGAVYVRPKGSKGTGAVALSHGKAATSNLSLLKVGLDGSIQLRAGSGAPRVAVTVLGWVPTTSALAVPENPVGLSAITAGSKTRSVKISGRSGIPAGATSVVLGIRTSKSKKGGTLAVWTKGAGAPARGIAFTTAAHSSFVVVRPDAAGYISVRALSGSASTSLQVLGWTAGTTTLKAPSTPTGPRLKSTSKYTLTLAGANGIPSAAKAVSLTVNAPKGWRVKVWASTRTSAAPVLSAVSAGAAQQAWVRVPSGRKIAVQVKAPRKTSSTATLMLGGYADATGEQMLSVTPKPGTRLLSSGDVVAEGEGGVIELAASSGGARIGDYLFVRSATSAPYLGHVIGSETIAGGRTRATLQNVTSLSEAFDEYDTHFTGRIQSASQAATLTRSSLAASVAGASVPGSIGMNFLESEHWNCNASIDPSEIIDVDVAYEGSVNLDVSLSERSIDFSSKGAISITFTFLGGTSVSCSVSGELPGGIPIPGTGLTIKFGGEGVVQATNPGADEGGLFSITGGVRAYAGFYYFNGEKGGTGTVNPFAIFRAADDREATGQIDLGLTTQVRIADVPFLPEPYEADAGMTTGVSFKLQAPDPGSDRLHRTMRGPRCIDLTATPFVKFGAKLIIVLAPDITFESDPIEGEPKLLYAGPCVGYTGTISYSLDLHNLPGSCTAEYCQEQLNWKRMLTKTLVGQAADFGRFYDPISGSWGAPISQPYSWSYSQDDYVKWTVDPCWAGLGCGDISCEATIVASGSGSVAWDPDDPVRAWFLDGYDSTNSARAAGIPYGTVSQKTTRTGDPDHCGETTTTDVTPEALTTYFTGTLSPILLKRKVIDLTLTGQLNQWHPELTFTTKVKLVRHEYER